VSRSVRLDRLPGVVPESPTPRSSIAGRTLVAPSTARDRRVPHRDRRVAPSTRVPAPRAHLGHGGRVVDEGSRCPFHGFHFGTDARVPPHRVSEQPRCASARGPGPSRSGTASSSSSSRSTAAARVAPPHFDMEGWTEPYIKTLRLRGHIQDTSENSVEPRASRAVHNYFNLRDPELTIDGTHLHSRFGFDSEEPLLPRGSGLGGLRPDVHGLGFSLTDLTVAKLGIHYRLFLLATQIDAHDFCRGRELPLYAPFPEGSYFSQTAAGGLGRMDVPILSMLSMANGMNR